MRYRGCAPQHRPWTVGYHKPIRFFHYLFEGWSRLHINVMVYFRVTSWSEFQEPRKRKNLLKFLLTNSQFLPPSFILSSWNIELEICYEKCLQEKVFYNYKNLGVNKSILVNFIQFDKFSTRYFILHGNRVSWS